MFDWLFGSDYPCLRQVIVNTRTGHAFSGVLWQKRRGYLVLRNAQMLKAGGETAPIDGEVVIERDNVDFTQVVSGVVPVGVVV